MPISVLMYHQVGEFRKIKYHRATYCRQKRFKSQMWFLKFFGYHVISINDLLKIIENGRYVKKKDGCPYI